MSPFRSEAQRRFMFAKHPEIAKRWSAEYGSAPQPADRKKKTFKKRSGLKAKGK